MQIFSDFLFAYYIAKFKKNKKSSKFPSIVTLADTIPVFNKGDKECKNDYRPVGILSNMSKILERIIFRQISSFMESFFSKYQCGFWKGCSAQHCLLLMVEKWRFAVDNGKVFEILWTELSKTLDCLSHERVFSKFH